MITITLQRNKCIGCNYCVEMAAAHFTMSKKDGKTVLHKSIHKKGFYTAKEVNHFFIEELEKAAKACPVKIISVKKQ